MQSYERILPWSWRFASFPYNIMFEKSEGTTSTSFCSALLHNAIILLNSHHAQRFQFGQTQIHELVKNKHPWKFAILVSPGHCTRRGWLPLPLPLLSRTRIGSEQPVGQMRPADRSLFRIQRCELSSEGLHFDVIIRGEHIVHSTPLRHPRTFHSHRSDLFSFGGCLQIKQQLKHKMFNYNEQNHSQLAGYLLLS